MLWTQIIIFIKNENKYVFKISTEDKHTVVIQDEKKNKCKKLWKKVSHHIHK